MIRELSLALSAGALLLAVVESARLARGAPRRERIAWLALAIVLLVGAAQRLNIGLRAILGDAVPLPTGVEMTLAFNSLGVAAILWYFRPILVRYRRQEHERRASDERFHRALSQASDPVAIIDAAGIYTYVNDAGSQFFKYAREQIVGRHFRDFIVAAEPQSAGTVARAIFEGVASIQREILRGDGTQVSVECDLISLGDGNVLIIGHDLTARQEVALAQARVRRLEAMGALASGVAHDFNNLITIIRGAVELASEYGTERVPLDGAMRAIERAASLARELIDFSRATTDRTSRPEPNAIDIRIPAEASSRMVGLNLDGRVALEYKEAPEPVSVRAESRDIERICTNLLVNAQDAILELIGTLTEADRRGRIELQIRADGPPVSEPPVAEIVVRDNGSGVRDDVRDKIFEPFFTTKAGGRRFGLGLAATHELVTALGGTINVSSQAGGGTVFTVRLPLATDAAPK